jgi:hypothetical protein
VIVKMIAEKQNECRIGRGNPKVLGENLPQRRYFCPSQNPT